MNPFICFGLVFFVIAVLSVYIVRLTLYFQKWLLRLPIILTMGFSWYFVTLAVCPYFQDMGLAFWDVFDISDSFSISLCIMTNLFFLICLWSGSEGSPQKKYIYSVLLLFMQVALFICFTTADLFVFYIAFEVVTLLMFFVILGWGYERRRSLASFYFFYFTFISSLFFLLGILSIYTTYRTTSFFVLLDLKFTWKQQNIYWWLFFFAFAVKVPMYPFHIWLPEAHVEAPTGGSIILAAILLKLGFYGFFRFSIPLFPMASHYYSIFIFVLALLGVYHSMIVALRQIDAKRIVAYSSVAHMNFAIIGLFTFTFDGVLGSLLFMFSHGFVSGGMFYLIGMLYKRYGTRSLFYYGGLLKYMPVFALLSFLFVLGNIGFPLTFNFIGEFYVFISVLSVSKILILLLIFPLILNLVNSLLLFTRTCYGVFKYTRFLFFIDAFFKDYIILWVLLFLTWFLGLCPMFLFDFLTSNLFVYDTASPDIFRVTGKLNVDLRTAGITKNV